MFLLALLASGVAQTKLLMIIFLLVSTLAIKMAFEAFCVALRRMRWLFLSILIVYGFATPGELIPYFSSAIAPTFEGVYFAFLQISRLVIALAALTILLTTTTKEALMLGLYMLFLPLKYIGLQVEQFSVRLLLTINYVEQIAIKRKASFNIRHFHDIHQELEGMSVADIVNFEKLPIETKDKVLIAMIFLIFSGILVVRFV